MKKNTVEKHETQSEEDFSTVDDVEESFSVEVIKPTSSSSSTSSSKAALNQNQKQNLQEKLNKEPKASKEKKFHRVFKQVPHDERLIDYFSCALVGDILLQGRLYVSKNYFAFHSNVFGYVTKVLIPTTSVTKISKEKIVKLIPNAIGITTKEERHVFASFLSRDIAFELLCSVCGATVATQETPSTELSEEYSPDESSEAVITSSENRLEKVADTDTVDSPVLRKSMPQRVFSDIVESIKKIVSMPSKIFDDSDQWFPIYLGGFLAIILTCLSGYLFLKILEMESKLELRKKNFELPKFDDDTHNDLQSFVEQFKLHKEKIDKCMSNSKQPISAHIDTIAKLRENIENLSNMIRQRRAVTDHLKTLQTSDISPEGDSKYEEDTPT